MGIVPIRCLEPYCSYSHCERQVVNAPSIIGGDRLVLEAVFNFGRPPESTSRDAKQLLAYTLQVVQKIPVGNIFQWRQIVLCEASYQLPMSLGTESVSGTGVSVLNADIMSEFRAQHWGNPSWYRPDMHGISLSFSLRFRRDESEHDLLERYLNAGPLLDNLANIGLDVREEMRLALMNE